MEFKKPSQQAPRVTVGMPVYNGAALFSRAINSILAQSFQEFEIVISDNASDDGTSEIVNQYRKSDGRIRVFRQPKTISGLMNYRFVLEQAKGELFFWAPHDDWWHPDFIASAVKALEAAPMASAAMGTVHYIDRNDKEFLTDQPPYALDDANTYLRIRSYLLRNVTDNLYYSVFRRTSLKNPTWSLSTNPDKIIIMHLLGKGPIVDGWGMEYFNQYSFKTSEQVVETFLLSSSDAHFTTQVFVDLLTEIRQVVGRMDYIRLAWTLLMHQHWYKYFAKLLLTKLRILRSVGGL